MKNALISFIVILASLLDAGAQKIKYVDVEGTGRGADDNSAVESAIVECVSQVNGLAISTKSQLEAVESISDDESYSSQKLKKRVASATRGIVASYEIISVNKTESGIKEAKVRAKIAKYDNGNQNRLRIAIFPLKTLKDKYNVGDSDVSKEDVSRISTQALVDKMVATRKFTVLDREYADDILQEKATIANADTPIEEMCKFGQVLGADYIVVGVVESLTSVQKSVNMKMSGLKTSFNDSGCGVSLRFIDVATSQIKFSGLINTKVTLSRNIDSPIIDIFKKFADAAVKKVIDNIYPLRVVAVEGDEVILNQGGESVVEGDRYEMFALGEIIKDPYTGESLGRKETKCGDIEIIRVKSKTSDARILNDSENIKDIFKQKEIVCRILKDKKSPKKQEKLSNKEDIIW